MLYAIAMGQIIKHFCSVRKLGAMNPVTLKTDTNGAVRCGTFISVYDPPHKSTQPGHPFVGRCNKCQQKGGDTLWLGSKGRYGSGVGGKTCDPIVTHGPYPSVLKDKK